MNNVAATMPDDSGQGIFWSIKSLFRDLQAYEKSSRAFTMSKVDVLTTAGSFNPPQAGHPGPVPKVAAEERAKEAFRARFGHLRPELEQEKADADAAKAAADAELKALDREIAASPMWVKQDGVDAKPLSIGKSLFALLLLVIILALSVFAWVNTANLSLDLTQSWTRSLLYTIPLLFAPWFTKLIVDFLTEQSPAARPVCMTILVFVGVVAFGLFLVGYYQNVLANNVMANIFQGRTHVSPVGLQITAQILYENAFGALLVDKYLAVLRSGSTRNPHRQELEEKRREAATRYNAANARHLKAAQALDALDADARIFVELVLRLVALKWQLRENECNAAESQFNANESLSNLQDRMAEKNVLNEGANQELQRFIEFLGSRAWMQKPS